MKKTLKEKVRFIKWRTRQRWLQFISPKPYNCRAQRIGLRREKDIIDFLAVIFVLFFFVNIMIRI